MSESETAKQLRRQPLGQYRYVRLRWRILFGLIDFVGQKLFGLFGAIRSVALGSPAPTDNASDPETILLVQLDQLGDAIISTVVIRALGERYPDATIEVLGSPANRELFEAMDSIDRVHVSRWNRLAEGCRVCWIAGMFWWGWKLRRRKFDLGIDVRGEFPHNVILWLSGARRRVGWDSGGGGFLLTDTVPFVLDRPEVESRVALLGEIGIDLDKTEEADRPKFQASLEAGSRVAEWLGELTPAAATRKPRVVLHIGAGTPAKRWPREHWRELVWQLVIRLQAQVILVGGSADRTVAHEITDVLPPRKVADWTGLLNVNELAALLEQADLAVGADSGPVHLAAAVGTPVVVLFSGTNRVRQWKPSGRQVRVVRHQVACSPCHARHCRRDDHPCMNELAVDAVAAAIELLHHEMVTQPGGASLEKEQMVPLVDKLLAPVNTGETPVPPTNHPVT